MAEHIVGQILWGSNAIYYVQSPAIGQGLIYECRFRGKKLQTDEAEYNPLAPGDFVRLEPGSGNPGNTATAIGMIVERLPRKNSLERWNRKRNAAQVIVANIDLLAIVTSVASPPFRPRFVDRCIVAAESQDLPVLIIVNKVDLGISDQEEERIMLYRKLGYDVLLCSVVLGEGIENLKSFCSGKLIALTGQSGVGKSSLLSSLDTEIKTKIGEVSQKFNRGTHTTTLAKTWMLSFCSGIIDTPGIRQLELLQEDPRSIASCFRDFEELSQSCEHYNCTHRDEPGCAISKGVERGLIHPDRYDSYIRIVTGMEED